jgi:nucleoside-diphosphate-sugar epimerase
MAHSPHILVTGATGAVGPLVVAALYGAGYRIRTLSIDSPPDGVWPDGIEARIGDISDPAAVQSAVQRVDGVIHMAALLHIVNPPPELQEKYERINVGGTAAVVEAARQAGVGRLVFFSTIAVYGASAGNVLAEDSPANPDSFYAQTKLDAERIVLAAKRADGKPLGTVLRLGAVYGARIKGNYQRLLLALAGNLGNLGNKGTRSRIPGNSGHVPKFPFIPVGSGLNRRTLVYDKDVARAALLALEHPEAAGKVFNVTDGQLHPMKTIIETLCDALGRRPPRLSLPVGPTLGLVSLVERILGVFVGTLSQFLANLGHVPTIPGHVPIIPGQAPPPTSPLAIRAMIEKYIEDIAVDSRRIQKELGFVPQYDLKTGWEETIREMRK